MSFLQPWPAEFQGSFGTGRTLPGGSLDRINQLLPLITLACREPEFVRITPVVRDAFVEEFLPPVRGSRREGDRRGEPGRKVSTGSLAGPASAREFTFS